MNIEKPAQQPKKKSTKKGSKKGKPVQLDFDNQEDEIPREEPQDDLASVRVRARPDLKAKIDELFEAHVGSSSDSSKETLDYYFNSYSHYGIHEEMLQDQVRTNSYRLSMIRNKHLFKDKVVLDVGCGTGVLSIFAASAGAKHVYAIDNATIHLKAKEIVTQNGYSDRITVLNGKVEELELPVDKVDIIISEWMGYFLLYEGMFDSVIFARDKWLAPDGLLFPDRAIMYLKGIDDAGFWRDKLDFWNSVYGYNYQSIKKWIEIEPLVEVCPRNILCTDECAVLDLNLQTATRADLDFANRYTLKVRKDTHINGICVWFDTLFTHGNRVINLTTSPDQQATHWKQCIVYLEKDMPLKAGEELNGSLMIKKNEKNPRDLDIKLSYHYDGVFGKVDNSQYFLFA